VKKTLVSAAAAAALFAVCLAWTCFPSRPASAQPPMGGQPAMSQAQLPIALVDVGYIIKRHVRLKAQLNELKAEGDRVGKEFEDAAKALQERAKPLGPGSNLKAGSPEYNALEEQLTSEKSTLQAKVTMKRKEFMQKEAHLYYNAYLEIGQEVKYYCDQRGIVLCLNFNGDTVHEDNPQEIMAAIATPTKPVYYRKDSSLDITPFVMQRFVRQNTADTGGNFK
jgi:Skp family chaperone for outer membrane proteins